MRNWISIFIIFTVSTTVNAQVSVGESAPDFTLSELGSGESVTLSDFNDKVVYIFFMALVVPIAAQMDQSLKPKFSKCLRRMKISKLLELILGTIQHPKT